MAVGPNRATALDRPLESSRTDRTDRRSGSHCCRLLSPDPVMQYNALDLLGDLDRHVVLPG